MRQLVGLRWSPDLAMHGCYILSACCEPSVDVDAEVDDLVEGWRVVVVEGVLGHTTTFHLLKLGMLILSLRAEVVDLVSTGVKGAKEVLDLRHRIAISGLRTFGRKTHRDQTIADVCQREKKGRGDTNDTREGGQTREVS